MSHTSKSAVAAVALLAMVLVISRQLFLYAAFRDPQGLDPQGGRYHLVVALIAGVIACAAGVLLYYSFGRNRRSESAQPPQAPLAPGSVVRIVDSAADLPSSARFDAPGWARLNPWLSEGRADDRRPMDGSVTASRGTPSGQRTLARESHQVMFKKWSQARHEGE